jgi:ATP-dependent protease ClpP protease subunit
MGKHTTTFLGRTRGCAERALEYAEAGERGELTAYDEKQMIRLLDSQIPIWWQAVQVAAEYEGVNLGGRSVLVPSRPRREGITIVNAKGPRPQMYLYGDIGGQYGGIAADDFRRELTRIPDTQPFDLHINSDGGDFTEGVAIASLIANRLVPTHGFVDGTCASAATFALMKCSPITMARGSWLMIHNASAKLQGGVDDFRQAAEVLAETNAQIAAIYRARWTGTDAALVAALAKETWFSPETAIAAGLADDIADSVALAAKIARGRYVNTPELLIAAHDDGKKRYGLIKANCKLWMLAAAAE